METVDEVKLDASKFDVYIRMNANPDHDYCFQVGDQTTFEDLLAIFTTLPVMLNQSVFYDRIPTGFRVSTFPGHLTRTGGVLFGLQADFEEYLENVGLKEKVKDRVLPGQLIVPVFRHRTVLHLGVVAVLALWLYTDLPDAVSPTPGICLSRYAAGAIAWGMEAIGRGERGIKFYNEIMEPVGVVGQCIYFAFHIFKVLMLYFILWAGLFNPYKFFGGAAPSVDKEALVAIGWTGAKKVSSDKYQNEFRKRIIAKHGGILKAYTKGFFPVIKNCVMELEKGEGYDSAREGTSGGFKLSWEMLREQQQYFAKSLEGKPASEAFDAIKSYREYGPFDSPSNIKARLEEKFGAKDLEIKNAEESKKKK